jgi:hypothetical protein
MILRDSTTLTQSLSGASVGSPACITLFHSSSHLYLVQIFV